jgi:hypothetical protein
MRIKIHCHKAIVLMALFIFIASTSFAQPDGLGTWNVVSAKYTFNKEWSVMAEAQIRSQQFGHDFHYYEYKAGLGYNFKKTVAVLFAMGHYKTFQPDGDFKQPVASDEFRIWQQLVLTNNIGRLKLEHRYRIEQRFTSNLGYRNRFRYRLNAILPLNSSEIKTKTWYTTLYNEVFIAPESPFFEQNRIFFGVGYQCSDRVTLLTGFVHRFDQSLAHVPNWKNFFQANLFLSFDEFKSGRERHPSAVD